MRRATAIVLAAGLALGSATGAAARGFATQDLSGIGPAAAAAAGRGFDVKAEPRRLTLLCSGCAGTPIVDILLGQQTDGTEGRVRSGATGMADLERLCRARSPTCTVSALAVAPAVGWVSSYPLGGQAGSTAVIVRDGDLLTIRSLATDRAVARRTVDKLLPLVRARIVGR